MDDLEREKGLDRFLECETYDETEAALFRLVRSAYYAGWRDGIASCDTEGKYVDPA